jgi:hypothetical protein
MSITITLNELNDRCDWDKVCEMFGLDQYCLSWGNLDVTYSLTEEQAKELGLI